MIDKEKPAVATATAPAPSVGSTAPAPVPPKRSPGHRGADVKDTVAEMAAKAHEISLEAGSKMAAAMKDVIGAAAGLTGLVLESARDRKSTRLNSSHGYISYAVFCLKKKTLQHLSHVACLTR